MLTKSQIKLIKSLDQKKFRLQHQLFVVEGKKGITEFLKSEFKLNHLYTTVDDFESDTKKLTLVSESVKDGTLITARTVSDFIDINSVKTYVVKDKKRRRIGVGATIGYGIVLDNGIVRYGPGATIGVSYSF